MHFGGGGVKVDGTYSSLSALRQTGTGRNIISCWDIEFP
jgi:hypothetical protein